MRHNVCVAPLRSEPARGCPDRIGRAARRARGPGRRAAADPALQGLGVLARPRAGSWRPVARPPRLRAAARSRPASAGRWAGTGSRSRALTRPGFAWALRFEQVRRGRPDVAQQRRDRRRTATRTCPFTLPARGLRPGQVNTLVIRVDNRKRQGAARGLVELGRDHAARSRSSRGAPCVSPTSGLMPELDCRSADDCDAPRPARRRSCPTTRPRGCGRGWSVQLRRARAPATSRGAAVPVRTLDPGETRPRPQIPDRDRQAGAVVARASRGCTGPPSAPLTGRARRPRSTGCASGLRSVTRPRRRPAAQRPAARTCAAPRSRRTSPAAARR